MYRHNKNLIFKTNTESLIKTVRECDEYEKICFPASAVNS